MNIKHIFKFFFRALGLLIFFIVILSVLAAILRPGTRIGQDKAGRSSL